MSIRTAKFIKSIVGSDELLESREIHQVAFVGRSNVGKSSIINSLTRQKNLARSSSAPGRTREINVFLINKDIYLIDLPGYGFARGSWDAREKLGKLIYWYLFESEYQQKKVVLIIDAKVGPTDDDLKIIKMLDEQDKDVVVVANKVDKIGKSEYQKQKQKIQGLIGERKIIFYSAKMKIGVSELVDEILK